MKLIIPKIGWHGEQDRVLAVAFHPFMNLFVTGGSDSQEFVDPLDTEEFNLYKKERGFIKMWEIVDSPDVVRFIGGLDGGHAATVNCLKFSPNGQYLASSSDDYQVNVWERRMKQIFGTNEYECNWCITIPFPGHTREVMDLCWSSCGNFLVSASMDNKAILWSIKLQKQLQQLDGHTGFVQGVMMDPKKKYIVTVSNDRTARVFKITKQKKSLEYHLAHVIRKMEIKSSQHQSQCEDQVSERPTFKLFLDENVIFTFVRRPDWSPDGSFFILPCAQNQEKVGEKCQLGALIFIRSQPWTPVLFLNTNQKPALIIRFCPILFKKDQDNAFSIIDVPYKMIYAIATIDQVLIYNTQSILPLAIFGNMHFASLSEMSFRNATLLAISSCDGQCSFVEFATGELGEEYPLEGYIYQNMLVDMDEQIAALMTKEDFYKNQEKKEKPKQQQQQQPLQSTTQITYNSQGQAKKIIIPTRLGDIGDIQ